MIDFHRIALKYVIFPISRRMRMLRAAFRYRFYLWLNLNLILSPATIFQIDQLQVLSLGFTRIVKASHSKKNNVPKKVSGIHLYGMSNVKAIKRNVWIATGLRLVTPRNTIMKIQFQPNGSIKFIQFQTNTERKTDNLEEKANDSKAVAREATFPHFRRELLTYLAKKLISKK